MKTLNARVVLIALVTPIASCAFAQDPVIGSPDMSKVEIENAWVRVTRTKQRAHVVVARPALSARVEIALTDFHHRATFADGTVREVNRKSGEVVWLEATPQVSTVENLLSTPSELLIIELKPGAPKSQPVALDPVKLDPKHVSVALENERVRVLHTIMEPHLKSPLHGHPPYVVIYLNDTHRAMKRTDGTNETYLRKAGEVAWRPALQHQTESLDDYTAFEIQVEIK